MIKRLLISTTDNLTIQLFRYTFVGGLAFIFDFGILFLLTEFFDIYYLVSAAFAFLVGLTINYFLSIAWVFSNPRFESKWLEFFFFAFIGFIGLGINEIFIWFFTEGVNLHYLMSKIITTLFVYLWNFFCRKYLLFNKRQDNE